MHGIPGMYTPEHIRGWKAVTDAVHAKGAYMAGQLWHVSCPFPSPLPLLTPQNLTLTEEVYCSADVSQSQSNLGAANH